MNVFFFQFCTPRGRHIFFFTVKELFCNETKRAIPSNWCTYTMFLGLEKLNFDPFLFLVEIHGRPEKRKILQDLPSLPANWQSVPLKRPIYKKKGNIFWSDL